MADDQACRCGYRGVIFGPEHNVAMAICQPGHEPAPEGQEGTEPGRYPREVELANARLIAAAPDLLEAAQQALELIECLEEEGGHSPSLAIPARALRAALAKATPHDALIEKARS